MKLIILSPNLHLVFSELQRSRIESDFDVEYFTQPTSLDLITALQWQDEKIVSIDPDFCDWKITRENLEKMKNVKAVCLPTTAFHYIDLEYLKQRNIPVTNLRGFSTNAVAEQAFAMIFALARKIPMVLREWCVVNFERYRWIELRWKKLWIIWLWRIGSRIAEIGLWIGMEIIYWSRTSRNEKYEYKELSDLIESADVLVYALSVNEWTKILLTNEIVKKFREQSLFVSITHIDHIKFVKLVEIWKLWGYACDDKIWKLEDFSWNVLPGAELGWCTDECFQRNGEQWIEAIMDAKDGKYPNRVN